MCFHITFVFLPLVVEPLRNGPPSEQVLLNEPLYIHNITAVRVNSTSALVSWTTIQRNTNTKKFCRLYQEGSNRKESFSWTLQVLMWPNLDALSGNPDYETIMTYKYFSSYEHTYNMTLNGMQCTNQSYLLTNLSSSSYYKFQINVEKHKKDEADKTITKNGSYIHYFSKQS